MSIQYLDSLSRLTSSAKVPLQTLAIFFRPSSRSLPTAFAASIHAPFQASSNIVVALLLHALAHIHRIRRLPITERIDDAESGKHSRPQTRFTCLTLGQCTLYPEVLDL